MEKRIVKLEPYGDHRDAKSSIYEYKLDFEKILYNLSLKDCQFIISVLYKNIFLGEYTENNIEIYNTIVAYSIYERGSERWADISLSDSDRKLNWKSFHFYYDLETKQFNVKINGSDHFEGSAIIMIYEYFLNK